jgi:hypothetical protein
MGGCVRVVRGLHETLRNRDVGGGVDNETAFFERDWASLGDRAGGVLPILFSTLMIGVSP